MKTQSRWRFLPCWMLLCLLVGLLPGCRAGAIPACQDLVEASLASRDYRPDTAEMRLTLDVTQTELPSAARPIAIFLIPEAVMAGGGYQDYQLREEIDAHSELGQEVLAAVSQQLGSAAQPCYTNGQADLAGCTLVMGYMNARIGSCTAYPLAYNAVLTLSAPPALEAEIITAVAILDQDSKGNTRCIQIIAP